jgi:hypothetical protein
MVASIREEGSRDPCGKSNSGHLAGSQPLHSRSYAASYVRNLTLHECSGTVIASLCRPLPVAVTFPTRYSEYSGVCYSERGEILSANLARACA